MAQADQRGDIMRLRSSLLKLGSRNLSGFLVISCESFSRAFHALECFGTFLFISGINNRSIQNISVTQVQNLDIISELM